MKKTPENDYFIVRKDDLVKRLGKHRQISNVLSNDQTLNTWWDTPYKANPDPGQHLANRAMAVSTMVIDLLLLGDNSIQAAIPGSDNFAKENIDAKVKTRSAQVALYFFMLSLFIADATVPMHCDARQLSSASKGRLHGQLEKQ